MPQDDRRSASVSRTGVLRIVLRWEPMGVTDGNYLNEGARVTAPDETGFHEARTNSK
ncbi:hypothetical protein [uncultured Jannaschia sp.]|uniref:hypothetical protein n=1 Tax=uncultured Jannaschia sp. TaxID=293347 RepID=UPI002601994D|nr:hypothetical protein [uncultured Jannaschia sp.]